MKKTILIFAGILCFTSSRAQILCIRCYNQNPPLATGTGNLVQNGSFETTTCPPYNGPGNSFCPSSTYTQCTISNWTCTGGGTGTYADICDATFATVVQGTNAVYFGNYYCNSCSTGTEDTACLVNNGCVTTNVVAGWPANPNPGYGGTTGLTLIQTVTGLTIGTTYVLQFWAGGEALAGMTGEGLFAVDLGFGNTFLRNKPTLAATDTGTRYLIEFKATATSHTLKFTNWGHICGQCTELVLDDVSLYPIGELGSTVPVCAEAIDENNKAVIILSPNPSPGIVNFTGLTKEDKIEVYTIIGERIYQSTIINQQSSIDLTGYSEGMYFYRVSSKQGIIKSGKLVKE